MGVQTQLHSDVSWRFGASVTRRSADVIRGTPLRGSEADAGWLQPPDSLAVLPDGSIRGEVAHAGHGQNRLPRPALWVLEREADLPVAL